MKSSIKIFYWLPRVTCIFAIIFISMFATDAFSSELTIWQQIRGFLIHLIPSFILLAILILAWKWEYIGGILFTIVGLGLSPFIFMRNYNMNHSVVLSFEVILIITFPFVVIGILFIISHFMKKTHKE